jgi:hypothetical protein
MERKKILEVKTPDGKVSNSYEVEWPTVKQMIDIESAKLALSKGKYTDMILSGTKWMNRALNYIDMLAYFSVMCPKIVTDSKVRLSDIDLADVHKGLLSVYTDQFLPWWNEYEEMIDKLESGEEEDKEVESSSDDL